jgi:heterodisulfide reductase subunit A
MMGVSLDEHGFFKTDPLMPLDTTRAGMFVCGCAQGPMDIPESVAQASSAAARAAELVAPAKKAAGGDV